MCTNVGYEAIPTGLSESVTNVDLSDNVLEDLTVASMVHVRNVVELKMKNNHIESIEDGAFQLLAELQTLDLSHNRLKTIHQDTFSGALRLLHLDLSSNQLERVDGAFAEMHMLNRLDLRNNKIKSVTQFTFRDLTSLRYLLLAGNDINHLDRRAFRNLDKLMYLVLKGNPIGNADNIEYASNFLSYVDLSECGLRYVPRGLPNSIRYLQLRRNNMTAIHRQDLAEVPYVSILVLDENGLTFIEDGTFSPMIYLLQLWLNGNRLTVIPRPLPPSLQRLLVDSNQIGRVSDIFPEGSKITTLSLMGNNITYVSNLAFRKLPDLQSLDLSNNLISSLYSESFLNSSNLQTLQLSKNPLTYFYPHCFMGLGSLRTLTLAYIDTNATLHDNIFEGLDSLKKLDLDSSPGIVWSIFSSEQLLDSIQTVEDLSMLSAELTSLRPDFPDLFSDLAKLHISSTRWHCDTSMMWFRDWLLNTEVHVEHPEEILCYSPRSLYEQPIISLEDNDFVPATTTDYSTSVRTFPPVTDPAGINGDNGILRPFPTSFNHHRTPPPYPSDIYFTDSPIPDSLDPDGEYSGYQTDTEIDNPFPHEWSTFDDPWNHDDGSTEVRDPTHQNHPNRTTHIAVDIRTLPNDVTHDPTGVSGQGSSKGGGKGVLSGKSWIVIIATSIAAVLFIVILVTAIAVGCRKHKSKDVYQNAVKYQNRNDVLYFMPETENVDGSLTDSLRTTASKDQTMTLVSGRDINHEGPLRMYKWEDF